MPNVSPGVYSRIVHLSTYPQEVPGTIGFIALFSEKGPDNELVLTNATSFYKLFGEPDINYMGDFGPLFCQGKYVASAFLTQSDNLYVIRVTVPEAEYANAMICIDRTVFDNLNTFTELLETIKDKVYFIKMSQLDITGKDPSELTEEDIANIETLLSQHFESFTVIYDSSTTTLNYGNAHFMAYNKIKSSLSGLNELVRAGSIDNILNGNIINDILTDTYFNYNSSSKTFVENADGRYVPLFIVYGRGRGEYYNNFRLILNVHSNPVRANEGYYILEIQRRRPKQVFNQETKSWVDVYETVEILEVSMSPTKMSYTGDAAFISYMINNYVEDLRSDVNPKTDIVDKLFNAIVAFNKKMAYIDALEVKPNISKKISLLYENDTWSIVNDSNNLVSNDFYKKYSVYMGYVFDLFTSEFENHPNKAVQLRFGDDALTNIDSDRLTALLVSAYTGTLVKTGRNIGDYGSSDELYVDEILNTDSYYFNIVLDAAYPTPVKQAILTLCQYLRGDCFGVLDNLHNYSVNASIERRRDQNNFNSSYVAIYEPFTKIFDKFTGKYIWITPVYHVCKNISLTERLYDVWTAPAGFRYGVIEGVRELRFNARQGEREMFYINQINPIVTLNNKTVIWSQLTSSREPTPLQDVNIMRLYLYIKRALEQYCSSFIFEKNDADTWSEINRTISAFLEQIKNRRGLYDYSVEVGATDLEIKMKRIHVNVILYPTRVVEQIHLNFSIE